MFGIRPIYWIIINSVVSFIYLFIISKLLGKKQIAQLEFIDYVVGISLGSIAADMSCTGDEPFYYYLIAMSIFFILAYLVAVIGRKNSFLKRLLKGKPATLIYEGKINYKALKKNNIDVNDLLAMLRDKDYFDISQVAYAVFETSGSLSVLPNGAKRPVVIEDVKPVTSKASLTNILIVDGCISKSGLNEAKKDKKWLFEKANVKNKKDLKNIILATYDEKNDDVIIYKKEK